MSKDHVFIAHDRGNIMLWGCNLDKIYDGLCIMSVVAGRGSLLIVANID